MKDFREKGVHVRHHSHVDAVGGEVVVAIETTLDVLGDVGVGAGQAAVGKWTKLVQKRSVAYIIKLRLS